MPRWYSTQEHDLSFVLKIFYIYLYIWRFWWTCKDPSIYFRFIRRRVTTQQHAKTKHKMQVKCDWLSACVNVETFGELRKKAQQATGSSWAGGWRSLV